MDCGGHRRHHRWCPTEDRGREVGGLAPRLEGQKLKRRYFCAGRDLVNKYGGLALDLIIYMLVKQERVGKVLT